MNRTADALQETRHRSEVDLDRPIRIFVRVSPKEKAMFEKAARSQYKTLSEFAREVLHKAVLAQAQAEKA